MPKWSPAKTAAKKELALAGALKHGGTIHFGAKAAGINRETLSLWLKNDPEFKKKWEATYRACIEVAEDSLYSRGIKGDNTAMIFWMKGADPDKYKERVQQERHEEHKVTVTHTVDLKKLSEAELETLEALVSKARAGQKARDSQAETRGVAREEGGTAGERGLSPIPGASPDGEGSA